MFTIGLQYEDFRNHSSFVQNIKSMAADFLHKLTEKTDLQKFFQFLWWKKLDVFFLLLMIDAYYTLLDKHQYFIFNWK